MVYRGCIRVGFPNRAQCVVISQVSRMEQNFEVHHVINDDLHTTC
jgi:hypothetical protein